MLRDGLREDCFLAAHFLLKGVIFMAMLDISHLTFAHDGGDLLFDDVSFRLDTDWKLGFTGRNGRGKTTFLRLLRGELPYTGCITVPGGLRYVSFPPAVPDALADRPAFEVLCALAPEAEVWRFWCEAGLLGLDEGVFDRPWRLLSGGERTKLALSLLFVDDSASFALIDEPTNHLDRAGRAAVSAYLGGKSGFIVVSHDREFLDGCVDHILSINRTNIEIEQGNFSSWWAGKQLRDSAELAEAEQHRREARRLEEAARRAAEWASSAERAKGERNGGLRPDRGFVGHKAAKSMKRAKSIASRRLAEAEARRTLGQNVEESEALKLTPAEFPVRRLLTLDEVQVCYDGAAVHAPISLTLERGEKIALCGANGCGKSSLLRLIRGESLDYHGTLSRPDRLRISYVGQETGHLQGLPEDYARDSGIEVSRFLMLLRKLDFSRDQLARPIEQFSEGQKKKVLLARSLGEEAHLYVWDEPLNYIDVLSRMQIEALLRDSGVTMLFVEHDAAFCEAVATREVRMTRARP